MTYSNDPQTIYFRFPNRLGLIITKDEREKVLELLSRRSDIDALHPIWDPDKYETVEAFNDICYRFEEETVGEQIKIGSELKAIAEAVEDRYAQKFKTPEAVYKKALAIINNFSLTLNKKEQERHLSVNTLPLMGTGSRSYFGAGYMRTSFGNLPPDDRHHTCVFFIKQQADIQNYLAVLDRKGWDPTPINDAISKRAEYLISPEGELESEKRAIKITEEIRAKARKSTEKILSRQEQGKHTETTEPQPELFLLPTSPTTLVLAEILGVGPELDSLRNKKRNSSHGKTYDIKAKGKARRIVYEGAETVTLEVTDITNLPAHGAPTEKWLSRALEKINEQAIYNGKLKQDYISFPLQDAVDDGQYTNIRSARRGFEDASRTFSSFKGEKSSKEDFALEVFFTGAHIKKGQCYLFLNPRTAWGKVAGQYYTVMPRYYYALPDKASTLLRYIFYIARQRTKDIKEKGYFTIGFRSIQMHLNLPDEKTTKNPRRDIKDPIENAIEKIEEKHRGTFNDTSLQFELLYKDGITIPEDLSITEYLENGYLKVMLDNDLSSYFVGVLAKNTRKKLEADRKKKEREALVQAKLEKLNKEK